MVNLRWCFSFVQFSELNSKSVTYIIICDFLNKNKMMSLDCMLALQWDRVPEYPELPKTVGFSKRACVCTYWYCSSFRDTKTRFLKSCQIKALDPREKVSPPPKFWSVLLSVTTRCWWPGKYWTNATRKAPLRIQSGCSKDISSHACEEKQLVLLPAKVLTNNSLGDILLL